MPESNLKKGFKTREAAIDYQVQSSVTPAYSVCKGPCAGETRVTDPIHHAGGKVHTWCYVVKIRGGGIYHRWGSYVGA